MTYPSSYPSSYPGVYPGIYQGGKVVDSLVIADLFEVLGGGVQSDIPALQNAAGTGAVFQLLAPGTDSRAVGASMTWDLGTPQPTVSQVQSLLLDGERP